MHLHVVCFFLINVARAYDSIITLNLRYNFETVPPCLSSLTIVTTNLPLSLSRDWQKEKLNKWLTDTCMRVLLKTEDDGASSNSCNHYTTSTSTNARQYAQQLITSYTHDLSLCGQIFTCACKTAVERFKPTPDASLSTCTSEPATPSATAFALPVQSHTRTHEHEHKHNDIHDPNLIKDLETRQKQLLLEQEITVKLFSPGILTKLIRLI